MTNELDKLAQEIEKLGMTDLALNVLAGHYGTRYFTGEFNDNDLLFDLGNAAGRSGDLDKAARATALANRIIAGEFDAPVTPDPTKRISAIWVVMTVESNGQEQFVRFLNQPLMTPDPDKVGDIRKIAASMAVSGETVEIVKFVRVETVETLRAHP